MFKKQSIKILPVSLEGFLASAAAQVLAAQALNNDFNNKADGNLDMDSFKILNLALPTNDNDAVTKKYVDDKKARKEILY